MSGVDDRLGVALAVAHLPEVGPRRLRKLVEDCDPSELWASVRSGLAPVDGVSDELARRWRLAASKLDPQRELDRHRAAGVGVAVIGDPVFPTTLAADHEAPGLLVWSGDIAALDQPLVSVVGTRRCSHYGSEVAVDLGAQCAQAGLGVVSGLALGIDAAAHRGALSVDGSASPVAVVAGGLDVSGPQRNAQLRAQVEQRGVVLAEVPLGVVAAPWRFPARNRLIAALGRVLVVVESGFGGGSMHTVRQANARGRPVLAVPGPITSAASQGTNQLLSEGVHPCRDAVDVLVAMELVEPRKVRQPAGVSDSNDVGETPEQQRVWDAVGPTPCTMEQLVLRTGLSVAAVAQASESLVGSGHLVVDAGWYRSRLRRP